MATIPATTTTNAPVGPPDLGLRSTQRGDQKARHDRAVDSRLRRESGSDGKRHRQGQGHQADGDPGNQVVGKFVQGVTAQAKDGLRKPAVVDA